MISSFEQLYKSCQGTSPSPFHTCQSQAYHIAQINLQQQHENTLGEYLGRIPQEGGRSDRTNIAVRGQLKLPE